MVQTDGRGVAAVPEPERLWEERKHSRDAPCAAKVSEVMLAKERIRRVSIKGPFTNDVSREGEGGGWPISDERKGGCVDLVLTRGREGVQNPENLADVIC